MSEIKPFPHYAGFTDFTPVVPSLYWDVYSQEERIKALCMEYVKLIAFTDGIVDTVNAQYDIIKKIETDLPELIDDDVKAEIEALIASGEFTQMLEAAAAAFLEEKTAQISANTLAISNEVDRAKAAEGANALAIATEKTRAEGAEAAEKTRAEAAEAANDTAIKAERKRAKGMEILNMLKMKGWSRYPLVINSEVGAVPVEGGDNLLRVNLGTNQAFVTASITPNANTVGASNYLFTAKDGPEDTDIIGTSGGTMNFRNSCWSYDKTGTNGAVNRNVYLNALGQLYVSYYIYPEHPAKLNGFAIPLDNAGGLSNNFAYCTQEQATAAAARAVTLAGLSESQKYVYNNNDEIRLGIRLTSDNKKGTDCSGLMHMIWKYVGVRTPTTATPIIACQGKYVTHALANEDLDISVLKVGDMIGFTTQNPNNPRLTHCGIITAVDIENESFTICDIQGSDTAGPNLREGTETLLDRMRIVVRYWDDPEIA